MRTVVEVSWIDGRKLDYENLAPALDSLTGDDEYELEEVSFSVVDSQLKFTFLHNEGINMFTKVEESFVNAGLDENILFMVNH